MMEQVTAYLDYGLSIILSIYLLVRMEKKIELLTESIRALTLQQAPRQEGGRDER